MAKAEKLIEIPRYREKYKCLNCGEVVCGNTLTRAQINGKPGFRLHGCANGDFGIGCLIGFEKQTGDK